MRIAIFDNQIEIVSELQNKLLGLRDLPEYGIDSVDGFIEPPNEKVGKFDLVFMDIDWQREENGIAYAAGLYQKYPCTQIIFITGYNDRFSQDIFMEKTNLCGYLVKPIDEERMKALLIKAGERAKRMKNRELSINTAAGVDVVRTDMISYIESSAHKILIHKWNRPGEDISVYARLDDYEEKLEGEFIRIHKSYLVNPGYIKHLEYSMVELKDGITLPVSKRNAATAREAFFTYMKGRMG